MADLAVRPHTPERTCIGCRRKSGPAGLARVARHSSGSLAVGRSAPGRGAWLCAGSEACFDAAVRRRAFGRALRCDVPAHELERLRGRLLIEGGSTSNGPRGRASEGVGRT
jgi:predicted RNA-binding protein YlxR (DUF448 family)